jgi:hypothetical protein
MPFSAFTIEEKSEESELRASNETADEGRERVRLLSSLRERVVQYEGREQTKGRDS